MRQLLIGVLIFFPALALAAVEAVRQWEYEPTLLDGKAVPVAMTVVLGFGAREVPAVIPRAEWSR